MVIDVVLCFFKSHWVEILIGIISGLISSCVITEIYRRIDEKRDRYEYLNELMRFSYAFQKSVFYIGCDDMSDDYVLDISEDISKNMLPIKKQWVNLTMKEEKVCNDFIDFYRDTDAKITKCKLDIIQKQKGKKEYISEVEKDKLELSHDISIKAMDYWSKISDLAQNYIM